MSRLFVGFSGTVKKSWFTLRHNFEMCAVIGPGSVIRREGVDFLAKLVG